MAERRAYSDERTADSYDYSDDFSDDEPTPVKSAPEKVYHSPHVKARGRDRTRGKGRGRGHSYPSQARSDTRASEVTKRMLSASQLRMKELQNQLVDVKKQFKVVKDENRLFKRVQYKQEKALSKFQDRESDLPQMIQAHNNEVHSLREQLRRMKEKYEKTDRYLRDAEDELDKANIQMKKYKALSEQKNLGERSDLDRRLNKAELTLEEKSRRLTELERHLEVVRKNHRHEISVERTRYKEAQKQMEELQQTKEKMEAAIKEKERLLEAKNIYSNRLLKPASYNGSPSASPPPWRQALKKKSDSLTDLSAHDKAKAYEEKRKADEKKKKAKRSPERKQKLEEEVREKDTKEKSANIAFSSVQQEDSEAKFWRRQEERYKHDQQNRERQEEERRRKEEEDAREEARLQEQWRQEQREKEERERRERERREADERERKEREERERQQREREERERREAEEREREKTEQERRAREEEERLENEARMAEERRRKDELLSRLQLTDNNQDSDPFAPSDSTRGRGADPFPSTGRRTAKDPFADRDDTSNRKDYNFTRTIENMHQGKPAHDDVTVGYIDRQKRIKAANEDSEVGGYQPSFSGPIKTMGSTAKKPVSIFDSSGRSSTRPAATSEDKKSKLMADLFGGQAAGDSSAKTDDLFSTSRPAGRQQTQAKRSSGFPWDEPSPAPKHNGVAQRDSSALFGGGAALVEDDLVGNNVGRSNLLPRRQRQAATTFSSKPAVMAVDSLDDDIEEVVL